MKCERVDCVCAFCSARYQKRKDRARTPDYCGRACRVAATKADKRRSCDRCGQDFFPRPQQLRVGHGRFCSMSCAQTGRECSEETRKKISESNKGKYVPSGSANPNYKGRWIMGGYVWRNIDGRIIAEHRYVMEQHLGRVLESSEIIHHINHDKTDNRLENLTVMSRAEHMKEHYEQLEEARQEPLKGEQIGTSKLTERAVVEIRSARAATNVALAEQYGVTATMISYVRRRKNWTHI